MHRLHHVISAAAVALAFAAPLFAQTPAPTPIPAPPDVAAPPADAQKTKSGLASKVLTPGTGTVHPKATDWVSAHYTGWYTDGRMLDTSTTRAPLVIPLNGVIKGWTEGVQLMVVGEKRRFWIPHELAYKAMPTRPQGDLVFEIELLGIPSAPPPDVAAPPADAVKTKSGLASKVLQKGTGTVHPTKTSNVVVHYTGWSTKGEMFDSSLKAGQPYTTRLDQVIPGWTEGVQLMVAGEKRRFWIPQKLAYDGQEGPPKGMLVFDVELVAIK